MSHTSIWAAALTLALTATVATAGGGGGGGAAQPYQVTRVSGRYAAPPSSATTLTLSSSGSSIVSLPFTFKYFGTDYANLRVHAGGLVVFGTTTLQSGARPCSPYATGLDPSQGGSISYWTEGSAGDRVFKVAWDQLVGTSGLGLASFQLHLYESDDKVVFAYGPRGNPDTWSSFGGFVSSLSVRMDAAAPGDNRSVVPDPNLIVGHPGTDYEMSPVLSTYSGQFLYDELVTDADGIGSSVRARVPLAGFTAGLFDSQGNLLLSSAIAADGSFSITGSALDSNASGSLGIIAENDAARMTPAPARATIMLPGLRSVRFSTSENIGAFTIDDQVDGDGTGRSILYTARTVQRAREWARSRTNDSIPKLDVVVSDDSSLSTGYVPAQGTGAAAYLVVSAATPKSTGTASGPSDTGSYAPDTWDADVIVRTYGRYLLGAIAADPTTAQDDAFDKVTDDENAFAVGFGHYLAAVVNGRGEFIDGIDGESAAVIDIEAPEIDSRAGADVAGRIAASLYDLVDADNEIHDQIDGTDVEDRAFLVVDSLSSPVTLATFAAAWAQAGYDAVGLSRILIASQALVDDADERNDTRTERVRVGAIGVCVRDHILNAHNEDWFEIELSEAVPTLDVTFHVKALSGSCRVGLAVLDGSGAEIVADQADVVQGALVTLTTGPLVAGTYELAARNLSDNPITLYSLQAHTPLTAEIPSSPAWTVGRPYDRPLVLGGGVAPYSSRVLAPGALPPGIVIDAPNSRIAGTPTQVGEFAFSAEMSDAGDPKNRKVLSRTFTIHPALAFDLGPFVAFPIGRAHDVLPVRAGGTAPFAFGIADGQLPQGIELLPDALHFAGSADAVGSTDFTVDGLDVAGSTHSRSGRAVVTLPVEGKKSPADLLEGDQATGWFFDAVAGSRLNFTVKTAKKHAKRTLFEPVVLDPDGRPLLDGKRKAGKGKASVRKVSLPESGRYFLVTGSTEGEATRLEGTARVAAPKRLKGTLPTLQRGEPVELEFGALAGARVRLKTKASRKSGLELKVLALIDPAGNQIPVDDMVKVTGTTLSLDTEVAVGGTWTIVLQAVAGHPDDVSWSIKIRQPKRGEYSTD